MNPAKLVSLLVLSLCMTFTSRAQQSFITGYLKDSITHYPIMGGTITNWNTQKKAKTNEKGFFFIEATINDRLYVQAPTYHVDTLIYTPFFADTLTLYLPPSGSILPGVTVHASYTKYQLDSIRRKENFEALRGSRIHTVGAPPATGFGVNLSLDRIFKKKYQHQRKQEALFQRTEERLYVDYRFSPQLVAYYTGLKGESLRIFMYQHTPTYTWLRQHTSQQDVLLYVNDQLKIFKAKQAAMKH